MRICHTPGIFRNCEGACTADGSVIGVWSIGEFDSVPLYAGYFERVTEAGTLNRCKGTPLRGTTGHVSRTLTREPARRPRRAAQVSEAELAIRRGLTQRKAQSPALVRRPETLGDRHRGKPCQHLSAGICWEAVRQARPPPAPRGWQGPRGGLGLPAHCPPSLPPARHRPGTPISKRGFRRERTPLAERETLNQKSPGPPHPPRRAMQLRPRAALSISVQYPSPLAARREERSDSSSRGGSLSPRSGRGSHWRRALPPAVNPAARPRPTGGASQDAGRRAAGAVGTAPRWLGAWVPHLLAAPTPVHCHRF
nr:serine/arginine repetitive matrix protein 1-like [Camelus dromedarius]